MKLSFNKNEKLKSRKKIAALFESGQTTVSYPVKMFCLTQEDSQPTQAAFSVPKRNFQKAVERNRIKRQLKEAYRNHKSLVKTNNDSAFALLFLYIGKDKVAYAEIEKAVVRLLQKLES